MTKKDGLALLEKCKNELMAIDSDVASRSNRQLANPELVVSEASSASEIASKLNDLYFKHLEEENKGQSKRIWVFRIFWN